MSEGALTEGGIRLVDRGRIGGDPIAPSLVGVMDRVG
jgi:hypothetical protein